ncbi:phage holin [Bacillus sp. JJ722]|uniref:phage holin n=1 Tax=Bacillus sp. JJ722 TaxID=3122973 RepID=UPI003000E607
MNKDIVTLVTGFLSALLLFFGTIGVSFDRFTTESINAFGVLLTATIALSVALYAIWKNTYVSKKAKEQKNLLKKHNLK